MASDSVCVVAGVGPGNGLAVAHKFAAHGYRVALLARSSARLEQFAAAVSGSRAYPTDLTDAGQVEAAFAQIRAELGPVKVLVSNASGFAQGGLLETTPEQLESQWRSGPLALLLAARAAVPQMLELGEGAVIVVGATASVRTSGRYLAFASSKAGLRSVAESMAKDLGPRGIHVAHVIVDGVIDPSRPNSLHPESIAGAILYLAEQDASAWTFELDLRPNQEKW